MHRKRSAINNARILATEKRQKLAEQNAIKFRSRQQERFEERRDDIDLYKSQKVCEQLDSNEVNTVLSPSRPSGHINIYIFNGHTTGHKWLILDSSYSRH